jgi:hypothetical protein
MSVSSLPQSDGAAKSSRGNAWFPLIFIFVYIVWRPAWHRDPNLFVGQVVIHSDGRVSPGLPPSDAILIGAFENGGHEYVFHDPDALIEERLLQAHIPPLKVAVKP